MSTDKKPRTVNPSFRATATLNDYDRLNQWLRSKPGIVISYCKRCGVSALHQIDAVNQIKDTDPRCYALLVAEARAQGFPVH